MSASGGGDTGGSGSGSGSDGNSVGASGGGTPAPARLEATAPLWPPSETRGGAPLWVLGGVLAAIGAGGYLVTAWLPWVGVSGIGPQQQAYQPLLTPGDIASALGSVKWSAISVAGVLILPLLLRRSRAPLALIGLLCFALWTALAIVVEPSLLAGVRQGGTIALDPNLSPRSLTITGVPQTLAAYNLHLASLALCVVAILVLIAGMVQARRHEGRFAPLHVPHASGRLPGMGLLTAGLVIWGIGVLLFPWATVNCPSVVLLSGSCPGAPFGSSLGYGISAYASTFDGLLAIWAAPALLAAGALELLIGLWLGPISWRFCAWAALWLLVATGLAALADAGVGVVVAGHGAPGLQAGPWKGDNGIFAAFLGLLLGWIALALLVYRAARTSRAPAT